MIIICAVHSLAFAFLDVYEKREIRIWGHSSVGRAPALQAGCQEFESPCLHVFYLETGLRVSAEGSVAQLVRAHA